MPRAPEAIECLRCRTTRASDQFRKSTRGALNRICLPCEAEQDASAPATKVCKDCATEKPRDDFYRFWRARDGRDFYCIACRRVRAASAPKKNRSEYSRQWRARNPGAQAEAARRRYEKDPEKHRTAAERWRMKQPPEKLKAIRRNQTLRAYGITEQVYEDLLAGQGGGCALCDSKTSRNQSRRFHVDHDHETGAIRGLLCARCNGVLGMMGDNIEGVRRVLDYLERSRKATVLHLVPDEQDDRAAGDE